MSSALTGVFAASEAQKRFQSFLNSVMYKQRAQQHHDALSLLIMVGTTHSQAINISAIH